jgi:hypothetical protein
VDNPLSEFAAEPTEYVSQSMPAGELWEALSPTFHRVFGYGMGPDERKCMVQRGSAGLDGILRFLDLLVLRSWTLPLHASLPQSGLMRSAFILNVQLCIVYQSRQVTRENK